MGLYLRVEKRLRCPLSIKVAMDHFPSAHVHGNTGERGARQVVCPEVLGDLVALPGVNHFTRVTAEVKVYEQK